MNKYRYIHILYIHIYTSLYLSSTHYLICFCVIFRILINWVVRMYFAFLVTTRKGHKMCIKQFRIKNEYFYTYYFAIIRYFFIYLLVAQRHFILTKDVSCFFFWCLEIKKEKKTHIKSDSKIYPIVLDTRKMVYNLLLVFVSSGSMKLRNKVYAFSLLFLTLPTHMDSKLHIQIRKAKGFNHTWQVVSG